MTIEHNPIYLNIFLSISYLLISCPIYTEYPSIIIINPHNNPQPHAQRQHNLNPLKTRRPGQTFHKVHGRTKKQHLRHKSTDPLGWQNLQRPKTFPRHHLLLLGPRIDYAHQCRTHDLHWLQRNGSEITGILESVLWGDTVWRYQHYGQKYLFKAAIALRSVIG